jgi:hypothetical protein
MVGRNLYQEGNKKGEGQVMYDTPSQTPMLTYQQRRTLQLINLEEQIKLATSPRHNLDLLSQILTIKFDLKHLALAQVNGKEIRI